MTKKEESWSSERKIEKEVFVEENDTEYNLDNEENLEENFQEDVEEISDEENINENENKNDWSLNSKPNNDMLDKSGIYIFGDTIYFVSVSGMVRANDKYSKTFDLILDSFGVR